MQIHKTAPSDSLNYKQFEDTQIKKQFDVVYEGFYSTPRTMKELSVFTGIDRANICRYCKRLRMQGKIAVVQKARCSITKYSVSKYTTNPSLFLLTHN